MNKEKGMLIAGVAVAAIGFFIFYAKVKTGLTLFEFGDEAEKFVAAQMISQGGHLYRDIFAHHGPVPYAIAHLYVSLVDSWDFTYIRVSIALLALLSCVAIYWSPVFRSQASRLWASGIYLILLSTVWILQGIHMVLYHQIGGFLLSIPFLHLFAPLFFGAVPNRYGLLASGFALALSCFTAYAFGPAALMLTVASLTLVLGASDDKGPKNVRKIVFPIVAGGVVALLAISAWLFLFADIKGFFVYHIYFNQSVYSEFIGFSVGQVLGIFNLSLSRSSIIHVFVVALLACWVCVFLVYSFRWAPLKETVLKIVALSAIVVSVVLLNPRGGVGFHESAFVIVNMALFAFACGVVIQRCLETESAIGSINFLAFVAGSFSVMWLVGEHAVSSPHGVRESEFENYRVFMRPEEDGAYELLSLITEKKDDFLALIFNPALYIKAGQLPVSGNYYYLPWQASYNKNPVAGYKIDVCQDIGTRSPAVIWFDNWKVWGRYLIDDYEPCVPAIIRNEYLPLGGKGPWFIRRELVAEDMENALGGPSRTMHPSYPLSGSNPIRLSMTSGHQTENVALKRVGVMFGTYVRENPGEAELRLNGPAGAQLSQRFSLPDLADNKYRYFDLDSKNYTAGEIVSISGGGVSTWESHDENAGAYSCIIYQYTDGKLRFTPGCPLF